MTTKTGLFVLLRGQKRQVRRLGRALSISALNQVVTSGTNFLFGLYLVRILSPAEFGLYGIGFAISLLYVGVGNALFLTQMVVHLPDKAAIERDDYVGRVLLLVVLFCLATVVFVGIVFFAGGTHWSTIAGYGEVGYAITAAATASLLRNFFVRDAYSKREESRALAISVGWAAALFGLVVASAVIQANQSAIMALWVLALSNILGALIGFVTNNFRMSSLDSKKMREDLREMLIGGRWALGGVSVTWLQTQAYMYVTALFLGPTGVAFANAARLAVSPFFSLLPAINQVALPRLSEARISNRSRMLHLGYLYTSVLVCLGLFYIFALLAGLELIIPVLLGGKYGIEEIGPLVAMWCLVLLFQLARDGGSIILQALKAFRPLMLYNVTSGIAAITSAFVLASLFSIKGAILGAAVGELLLAILLWKRIRNEEKATAD